MRLSFLLGMLVLLFCGCAATGSDLPTQPTAPAYSETAAPTTIPTTVPVTESEDPLHLLLAAMTLEEKVGQLFLARCPEAGAPEDISSYHLGGFLLFGRDFEDETPDSVRRKIVNYQRHAPIPLLIAVDEEGGTVCRVSRYEAFRGSPFPSPRESYAAGGMERVLATEQEKSAFLADLGINVNIGPVCDISTDPGAFMYKRSLGESPEETGRFVCATVQVMKTYNIGSVLKHFPGYGNNDDTHIGIVRDDRTLEELEQTDLVPFSAGIEAGCDAVLVSHNVITALDESMPASLSPAVHDYLRNTMNFDGVIVTDDLVMEAITDAYGPEEAAILAVLAGNDLLCSSEYQIQYPAVLEAVQSGRISTAQLEESVLRVLAWKQELGLIF